LREANECFFQTLILSLLFADGSRSTELEAVHVRSVIQCGSDIRVAHGVKFVLAETRKEDEMMSQYE